MNNVINFNGLEETKFKLIGFIRKSRISEFEPEALDNLYKFYFELNDNDSKILSKNNNFIYKEELLIEVTLEEMCGPGNEDWEYVIGIGGCYRLIDSKDVKIKKLNSNYSGIYDYKEFISLTNTIDVNSGKEVEGIEIKENDEFKLKVFSNKDNEYSTLININWIGSDKNMPDGRIYVNEELFESK